MQPTETPTTSQVVARNTKAELTRRGMSQVEFANGVGWSNATASRRLNGKGAWPVDDLLRVATFFDIDPEALTSRGVPA